jgi:hypothetical protein
VLHPNFRPVCLRNEVGGARYCVSLLYEQSMTFKCDVLNMAGPRKPVPNTRRPELLSRSRTAAYPREQVYAAVRPFAFAALASGRRLARGLSHAGLAC